MSVLSNSIVGDLFKKDSIEDKAIAGALGAKAVADTSEGFRKFCQDNETDMVDFPLKEKIIAYDDFLDKMTEITKKNAKIFL